MILSYADIEHIAGAVSEDFYGGTSADNERPFCFPIERFASTYLGLSVAYARLSNDGSVLGVTAYQDTEYVVRAGDVKKIISLARNQVLLDKSLAGFKASAPSAAGASHWLTSARTRYCSSSRPRKAQQPAESPMRCAWRTAHAC